MNEERPSDGDAGRPSRPGGEKRLLRERRLAEAALDGYGLRGARMELLRQEFVQVFRVVSPAGEEFVLRLYIPPRQEGRGAGRPNPRMLTAGALRSRDVLLSQLSWLAGLARETSLPVSRPLPFRNGQLVGHVSFEKLPLRRALLRRVWRRYRDAFPPDYPGRHCVLLRWVPGEQKEDLSPREASIVGSFLARMHRYSERRPVPVDAALPPWEWHWPFGGSAPLWDEGRAFYSGAQMAVFEETARRVREDLDTLGRDPGVFGVVHRDLNLSNIVFRGEEVGAIDFDLCGLGHYLLDLATTLTAVTQRASRPEQVREALLEGYDRERPLRDDFEGYLATFDAMRRVAAVNRRLPLLTPGARCQGRGFGVLDNAAAWLEGNYLSAGGP